MLLDLLKTYNWGIIWEKLNTEDSQLSDDEKLIKAFLLGYWWQDLPLAIKSLDLVKNDSASYYWVKSMIYLSNGNLPGFNKNIHRSKDLNIPKEFLDWTMIEYNGRASQFELQTELFIEAIRSANDWPYIAFLHSTKFDDFDPSYIINYFDLDSITKSSPLIQILFKIKIMDDLKLYELIEDFIYEILNSTNDPLTYSIIASRLYINNIRQDKIEESLQLLDLTSKSNYMDFNLIMEWMELSISHNDELKTIKDKINKALKLVPETIEYKGSIIIFALIYYWQKSDMQNIETITNLFSSYLECKHETKPWLKSFFIFTNTLYNFRVTNPSYYQLDQKEKYENIFIIGESHSLTLSNLPLLIDSKNYIAKTQFLIGAKMFHLKKDSINKFKNSFLNHINSLEENSNILFTIGEIDCRPNEGIWKNYIKKNTDIKPLIEDTIIDYLDFIEESIQNKNLNMIIIQGIPAPNYAYNIYEDYINKDNKKVFIKMIKDVNDILKKSVAIKKWKFLDVYSATVDKKGESNGKHHIDDTHLKPSFYKYMNDYIIDS